MLWDTILVLWTLDQVMAWCHQAASHYLNQCKPKPVMFYCVTRPHHLSFKSWKSRFRRICVAWDRLPEVIDFIIQMSKFVSLKKIYDQQCSKINKFGNNAHISSVIFIMMPCNGKTFHMTGPLWEEPTGHLWSRSQGASNAEVWFFYFMLAWTNCWTNSSGAGNFRCPDAYVL